MRTFTDWYGDIQRAKMNHRIATGKRLTNAEIAEATHYSKFYVAGAICGQVRNRTVVEAISDFLGIEPYDRT